MRTILRILLFLLLAPAAHAQLSFSRNVIDLGQVGKVYEISGDVVLSNTGSRNIHLFRADAGKGVKVFTSKRTLHPGDTALLVISFLPAHKGKFSEEIILQSNLSNSGHRIVLSGSIESVQENDLTACYYFGSGRARRPGHLREPMIIAESAAVAKGPPPGEIRHITKPAVTSAPPARTAVEQTTLQAAPPESGPLGGHVPNNIVILLDISSSMRDSVKLPVMKRQIHFLIDAIRDVDSVSLVTYADSVVIRHEAISGSQKEKLHAAVNGLKARGGTKGKKAIVFSQALAQKHYISSGNNLIILASDGKFRFTGEDEKLFTEKQGRGEVIVTTVALGDDREALSTLKQLASKGKGSFIRIRRSTDKDALLEEVSKRSAPPDKR